MLLAVILISLNSCGSDFTNMPDSTHKHTNSLEHASSPYLQQHAHNPVDWMIWGEEAFEKARIENKLVFISVGYSACHWCHVMEHQTFEDEEAAAYINENFVSIKVDREERPDVDAVYMHAVQIMTGRGGWPLNCIALPDGRPIFGGTYFQKNAFIDRLQSIVSLKNSNPEKLEEYAHQLSQGVINADLISAPLQGKASAAAGGPWSRASCNISGASIDNQVDNWRRSWDREMGLNKGAPKFPLPSNLDFLLHYGFTRGDQDALSQARLTLDAMARGGIYDQIGGGFSRYSTDSDWKVPHFEKMLYDNAQLLTTYSNAWNLFHTIRYKEVAYGIIDFINRELDDPSGGFRSALDADSEGVEGKYYVWSSEELKAVLSPDDYLIASVVYDIDKRSLWEHDNNVLMRWETESILASDLGLTPSDLTEKISAINTTLSAHRDSRIMPGLDDKVLTSWTALTVSGLCSAYKAFNDPEQLQRAERALNFILDDARKTDGSLYHVYHAKGGHHIDGFLEDYSFTIAACIDMYEVTFDPKWLTEARDLLNISFDKFYDVEKGTFWFTTSDDGGLFARKQENDDSVIPSSNSSMAGNLLKLGRHFGRLDWIERCDRMLLAAWDDSHNIRRATGWGSVLLMRSSPFHEIAITSSDPQEIDRIRKQFNREYRPQTLVAGASEFTGIPTWLDGKITPGGLRLYVCREGSCNLPVSTVEIALTQLNTQK
jgi:uncharacterized protein YyaL (SSP411 family)